MAADLATLSIRIDATGAITVLDSLGNKLGQTAKQAESLSATAAKVAAVFAGWQAAKWIQDTLNLGARYETLGVVMDVVGRNAGKTRSEMEAYQKSLQQTGISMIGARESLAKMAGAQLDLARSSELARVAQNAAVIAHVNSTEAFDTLINGITTGQPRILRTLGIFVDMEEGQKKYAKSLGLTVEQLSATQKVQANMNTTMAGSAAIVGTYEAAMGTAGKQLLSTVRYLEDTRVKASLAFQPQYTALVFDYAKALKWAGENAEATAGALAGVAASIVAIGVAAKSGAIVAFFATLANPAVLVQLAAIATLGAIFYEAATNAAFAARESKELFDALNNMSSAQLTTRLANVNAAIAKQVETQQALGVTSAAEARELDKLITLRNQLTAQLKLHALAVMAGPVAAANAEREAMEKLAQSYRDKAADTQREIAYLTTHRDKVVALTIEMEKLKKLNDAIIEQAARKAAGMDRIAGLGTGAGLFPIAGGFQGGAAPGVSNELALRASQTYTAMVNEQGKRYAEAWIAAELKAQTGMAQIRENFLRQFQQTFASGISDMLTRGLDSWREFFDSVRSLFFKLAADFASAKIMDKIFGTTTATTLGSLGAGIAALAVQFAAAVAIINAAGNAMARGIASWFQGSGRGPVFDMVQQYAGPAPSDTQRQIADEQVRGKAILDALMKAWRDGAISLAEYLAQTNIVHDATTRYIQTIRDQAEATDKARQAAEAAAAAERVLADQRSRDNLTIRLLTAQGDDAGAFAARQDLERQQARDEKRSQAYLDLLDRVLDAERVQRTVGAAGTTSTGTTGVVVARQMSASVTSFQGDRMVDELASSRIILRAIEVNTRGLRAFGTTVDTAFGGALQKAEHLAGNSMLS